MEKEILQVRMLGGFSMVYQEKTLVFDRNYISKSTQLLQILFLHLKKGDSEGAASGRAVWSG